MAVVITLVLNFRRYLRIYKTADYTQGGVISPYNLFRISLHPLEIQFLKCTINYDTCKFVESYFDTQGRALQGNLNDFSKKLNRTLSFKNCAHLNAI